MEQADSLMRYTIPMPDDSPIPGRNAEEMALKRLSSVYRTKWWS